MLEKSFFALLIVVSVFAGLSQASITNGDFSAVDIDGNPILEPWTPSPSDLVSNAGGYALFRENYDPDGDRISSLTQTFDSLGGEQKFHSTISCSPSRILLVRRPRMYLPHI